MRRAEDGEVRPYLAESMEPNEDLTEWTLTLRPDVQFHDGTPLNAQALKTVFDTYLKAPTPRVAATLAEVNSLDVVDDLTVVYELADTNAAFPDILTGALAGRSRPTRLPRRARTPGPTRSAPGRSCSRAGSASLQSGDVDVMQSLRQSTVVRARGLDGIDNYEHLGSNSGGGTLDTSKPPFDDVRVRQALALALDQEAIIEVLGGAGVTPPTTQFFSEDSPYWSARVAEAYPVHDVEKAQEPDDEYINDPDRSDGLPVGTQLSLTYSCPPDPSLNEVAQLVQSLYGALGAQVELEQVEQATWIQKMLARDHDTGCTRVGADSNPFIVFDAASTDGPLNMTAFRSPEIDAQLDILRTTTDLAARKAAVEEIGLVVNENVPNTFSGGTLTVMAGREAVKNLARWIFPDGTAGNGAASSQVTWGHVWLAG